MGGPQDRPTARPAGSSVATPVGTGQRIPIERALLSVHARARIADTIRAVVEDALDPIGADLTERPWPSTDSRYERIIEDVAGDALEELTVELASSPDLRIATADVIEAHRSHG